MSAPKGPRIKPVSHVDADGTYLVFPGRVCSVCSVGLTSRNRYGHHLMCKEHGAEQERARVRSPRTTERLPQSPERRRLHALFNKWARHPIAEGAYAALMAEMRDHELRERLRRLIPEGAASAPQVASSDTSINPNERT